MDRGKDLSVQEVQTDLEVLDTGTLENSPQSRLPQVLVAGTIILGTLIRFYFLMTPTGGLDGDEAVTGIMAQRIASGQDYYVYFSGQHYNSAIEQYPQAFLFWIGLPQTALILRLPQLALAGLSIWLLYIVAIQIFRSRLRAAFSACLFSLGPYFVIWKGVRSQGSYAIVIIVILLMLWCVLTLDRSSGPAAWLRGFTIGLCFIGTYSLTPSGYFILIPALLWALPQLWTQRRTLAATLLGGITGALPMIYWSLTSGEFPIPDPGTQPSTPGERLGHLLDPIGRQFIGVAFINGKPGWPVPLGRAAVLLLLALALAALVIHRQTILRLLTLRRSGRNPFDIVLLAIPLTMVGYVASKYAWFTTEPRYLFTAYPTLILALAAIPPSKRRLGIPIAAVIALFVIVPSVWMVQSHAHDRPGGRDEDLEQAVDVLKREGTQYTYANYWTAMPLEFIAENRLTVGSLIEPQRFLADRRAVDAAPDPVWVAADGVNTDDRPAMRSALTKAGISYRERSIGLVSLFDEFSRPVRPWEIGLGVEAPR